MWLVMCDKPIGTAGKGFVRLLSAEPFIKITGHDKQVHYLGSTLEITRNGDVLDEKQKKLA